MKNTQDQEINRDDTRRRILGALLGGVFWAVVGLGLNGLWDWVYLFGVPVRHGPGAFIGLSVGALAGAAWGLVAAWPRRWWAGVLLNGAAVYVVYVLVSLPLLRNLTKYPEMWSHDPTVDFLAIAVMPLVIIVVPSMLLAWLLRGILKLTHLALQRWEQAQHLGLSVIVLLLITVGLGLTWAWDQVNEAIGGERAALREVHRYGQAQGWKEYTLELEAVESAGVTVRVTKSDGRVHTCKVSSPLVSLTLGDTTSPDVTCQP